MDCITVGYGMYVMNMFEKMYMSEPIVSFIYEGFYLFWNQDNFMGHVLSFLTLNIEAGWCIFASLNQVIIGSGKGLSPI